MSVFTPGTVSTSLRMRSTRAFHSAYSFFSSMLSQVSSAVRQPMISSFPTFMGRHTAPSRGLQFKGAATSHHNHFILQTGRVGKLPDVFVLCTGHASGGCGRHRAGSSRGNDSRLGARQFRQSPSHGSLQIKNVDEVLRRFHLGLTNFRKLQRTTEISPRSPAINDGLYSETRIYILPRVFAERRGGLRVQIACRNLAQQGSSSQQFHERSSVERLAIRRSLIE